MQDHSAEIESLWRGYLRIYGEPQVRSALVERWPADPNVVQGRIEVNFPPTFQPGYIGPDFFGSRHRLVFLGCNPGEDTQATSRTDDEILGDWLKRFSGLQESLLSLSHFQADLVVKSP